MIILRCPACKQIMNYMPRDKRLMRGKKKRCVYCGKNFEVVDHIHKK